MSKIRIALAGIGNCASSLVQGISYYKYCRQTDGNSVGLMHYRFGPYLPQDIQIVAAFDIDARKVGKPLNKAIFAPPNNTTVFQRRFSGDGVTVLMGRILDGYSNHMDEFPASRRFVLSKRKPADVERVLRDTRTEILVNYLPVGSERATRMYAQCCLNTGVSLVNCIPVFIVSNPSWAKRFKQARIPCIGDDIKAQVGATIVHRSLMRLFYERGVTVDATYQLNTGGNTDFLNMLNRSRLKSKKISKTQAVQSQLEVPLPEDQVHIGPSDYIPWQKDNKVCFIRMEGRGFAGIPLNLELRLSVEDSPNSAGVAIDAIRCCRLARDRGLAGPLATISAYAMKHPPKQYTDSQACQRVEQFIAGEINF